MEIANANKFNRKSGVAEWRDLRFSPSFVTEQAVRNAGYGLGASTTGRLNGANCSCTTLSSPTATTVILSGAR